MMVFLALISGLINLSSQVVFQKVVSMTAGDLYTTFLAVSLTFILGSALGSYFGHRFRPYLAFIELATGLYSLFIFALLQGPFYSVDIPLPLVIVGLLLPALALGTHIPLYSYYLRRIRFGFVYFLYHFGAIFGLLAFEWHFVHAGSTSLSVLSVGLVQVALGLLILLLQKRKAFVLELEKSAGPSLFEFIRHWPVSTGSVFFASLISYYSIFWALKSQMILTNAFRMHATSISAAVFFWMAFAGVFSRFLRNVTSQFLFLAMAVLILAVQGSFHFLGPQITYLNNGDLSLYFAVSFLLSLYLTAPVAISSLVFIRETSLVQENLDVDRASGALNLFASIGNLAGFVAAALMVSDLWDPPFATFAIDLCLVIAVLLGVFHKKWRVVLAATIVIALVLPFALRSYPKELLFRNRSRLDVQMCDYMYNGRVLPHPLTTIALYTVASTNKCYPFADERYYVVDGLVSHNIYSGEEYVTGISSAKFFNRPIRKAMVIGIGTGQSAWAVASISEHVDLVDISPVVIRNLSIFKEFNNDLLSRNNVSFYLKDAFGFVRDCKPGSYDLIFNTSTQPSSYNASKLYSEEFIALAKHCLSEDGVLQMYFDQETVSNMDQFYEYMDPIKKHFANVDIIVKPYPLVFASNEKRPVHVLSSKDFIHSGDYDYFRRRHPAPEVFQCRPVYRNVSRNPISDKLLSRLDRSLIERNAIANAVWLAFKNIAPPELGEFYKEINRETPKETCE